ncbi:heterokaryon incompatibility protein-domain-containing protein [Cercophora newfieldiana]|uniref:Heterokaryon incompatibility protein-domain-containing protein n=1 Tax=Cercophora newfieldiana TaxID=92897 RepID=A0AA39YAU8_9PEZI|nr:heterokaryon incompatibility protein-domain-containing protein [Cercophora newfieldiana]
MRLINTHTLKLEEFHGSIPPYAILSHRWETEEVTFDDYPTQVDLPSDDAMKGFRKIRYCVDQAKKDGLDYCWVDTCCIDKSSSAELTEAINSMYAWYRDSVICYIYLSDVSTSITAVDSRMDDETAALLHYEIGSSQWFRRGWTLQELLAPRRRTFYNASWSKIMDLDKPDGRVSRVESRSPAYQLSVGLTDTIAIATGISKDVLKTFSSTSTNWSVALKMSWASNRQTTRIEDVAYSLMGIFDINMPLLYGEGAKAFLRLQEEIMKTTYDHTIFCWSDPSATCFIRFVYGDLAGSP